MSEHEPGTDPEADRGPSTWPVNGPEAFPMRRSPVIRPEEETVPFQYQVWPVVVPEPGWLPENEPPLTVNVKGKLTRCPGLMPTHEMTVHSIV